MEFENKKLKDENKSFREARDKNIFNEQIRNKNIEEIVKDKQILENMKNEYEKELKISKQKIYVQDNLIVKLKKENKQM